MGSSSRMTNTIGYSVIVTARRSVIGQVKALMSFSTHMLFFVAAGVSEDMVNQVRPEVYDVIGKSRRRVWL